MLFSRRGLFENELVCAIVDLGIVGLSVMCAHCGHNLFIYLCKT